MIKLEFELEESVDNKENRITFGKVILKLRKGKGWTQGQLSQQTGIDRSYISHIENDYYSGEGIAAEYISKFAAVFDVSEDFLREAAGQKPVKNPLLGLDQNPEMQDFVLHLMSKNPSPAALRRIRRLADTLMEEAAEDLAEREEQQNKQKE